MKKQMTYFNYEERNGLFLLCFLLLLFCTFIFLQKRVLPSESHLNIAVEGQSIKQGLRELQDEQDSKDLSPYKQSDFSEKQRTTYLPSKNPESIYPLKESQLTSSSYKHPENLASKISGEQSENAPIDKRGRANPSNKKDVRRIWNAASSEDQKETKKYGSYKNHKKPVEPFSINSTDAEQWKSIRGIGPKYAERIIKYQTWLGGFHDKEQLKEVYGITDSLFQTFEHLLINASPYKKIKINFATQDELGRHPYLYWKQAQKILRYRKHHGDFKSFDELLNIKGLDQNQILKIQPYLDFEPSVVNNDLAEMSEKKDELK